MEKLIKKLFTLKNILILLIIILALVGAIFPDFLQKLGFSSDQVILALLAGLAVDTLIERIGYLERIEANIASLENKVELRVSADNVFRIRDEMDAFLPWLRECEEMWISGRDLMNLLNHYSKHIQQAAESGKKFRFLIIDPDEPALMNVVAASSALSLNGLSREKTVRQAFDILKRMVNSTPNIKAKLVNWVPIHSYLIVDGQKENGRMRVEMFGYKIGAGERLHVTLTRAADSRAFDHHFKQFKGIWKDAKSLTIHSNDQES